MERPSLSEKLLNPAEQFIISGIDQDIAQLEEGVKRLTTLKEKGALYDPLDEDVEIYDEEKDITEKTRETVAATLQRKSNLLEQLSDIKEFWHYYIGEIIKWNPEKEQLPNFKAQLKQFLEENLERAIWIL